MAERESDFEADQTVWTAADLVSAAAARGTSTTTVEAARGLLRASGLRSPALARLLSDEAVEVTREIESDFLTHDPLALAQLSRARVIALRQELSQRPRSAFRWLDLALAHLTLGNVTNALKAVRTALSIAPKNRFVLRSSARFFVHTHDADEALHWLDRSGRVRTDPWLLSAHIAVSQVVGAPVMYFRDARSVLIDDNLRPISRSELSAAIASEELRSGRAKPARLYMEAALREPTDNAIAQAVWSQERGLGGVELPAIEVPRAYEAEALFSLHQGDWSRARSSVEAWVADEPFSVRAAVHGSYIAITGQEDYEAALAFAELGMRASPLEPMLLNNAAFALVNLGRVLEARELLNRAVSANQTVSDLLTATRGFLAFRIGDPEQGRKAYRLAEKGFKGRGEDELAALCLVMLAREEMRSGSAAGETLLSELTELSREESSRDAKLWLERIRRSLRRSP